MSKKTRFTHVHVEAGEGDQKLAKPISITHFKPTEAPKPVKAKAGVEGNT